MRPLTLKIAAGAIEAIPVSGRYVRNGDTSPTITVKDQETGDFAILAAGDAVNFATPYRRLLISHDETAEKTVVLNFGFGQILTSRTVGVVSVIDGRRVTTMAQEAFLATSFAGGAAGTYAHAQLWNPAGSGKNLQVSAFAIRNSNAGPEGVSVRSTAAALTTLNGSVTNKYLGGAASVAQCYTETNALPLGINLFSLTVPGGDSMDFRLQEPIIVPPGNGLLFGGSTVANSIGGAWEFVEESI